MNCTWKECKDEATHDQVALDNQVWARLCNAHHIGLKTAIGAEPKVMLRAWILAMGGREVAAKRIMGEMFNAPGDN